MNALSSFIPGDERIATIEDAAELRLQQDARGPDGDPAGEHRGQWRDHDPRPGQERAADAARPDHRRRVPGRRDAGHAPGDEHRPRRVDDHHPRQRHPRRHRSYGDDGRHGRLRFADLDHPPPDRLGGPPDRPGGPALRRRPQDHQDLGDRRHGGGRRQHAGHLRLQADRRRRGPRGPGLPLLHGHPAEVPGGAGVGRREAPGGAVRAADAEQLFSRGGRRDEPRRPLGPGRPDGHHRHHRRLATPLRRVPCAIGPGSTTGSTPSSSRRRPSRPRRPRCSRTWARWPPSSSDDVHEADGPAAVRG